MYGLVNKAIEGLIIQTAGAAAWETIKRQAGVETDYFVSMTPYPDEITYKLVAAASEVLNLPAATLLEQFGEYWTQFTAQQGYGNLLTLAGSNFKEILLNLDHLHAQVGVSFPQLRPPTFRCTEINDASLILHYYSERAGLAPMVVGLVRGLGKLTDTTVEVTLRASRATGADHDEFVVKYWAKENLA